MHKYCTYNFYNRGNLKPASKSCLRGGFLEIQLSKTKIKYNISNENMDWLAL